MNNHTKPNTERMRRPGWVAGVCMVAAITASSGCAMFGSQGETSNTRSLLVAARSSGLNMFGEAEGEGNSMYFTRAGGSLRQHTFSEIGADNDVDIDAVGGRIIFSSTRHNQRPDLYIKSVTGVSVVQLTSDPGADIQPAYSPDGAWVAFASNRGGDWGIWVVSVNGGQPVQVTSAPGDEVHPSWSPDGQRIVYCVRSVSSGQWELWITDAQVGATSKFIGYGLFPEWSPSGDTILFQRARERGSRQFSIWTLTLVDGEPRYPTEVASRARAALVLPTWSTDGRRIAYVSIEEPVSLAAADGVEPTSDIWVMWSDGRGKVRLTDGYTGNFSPAFSPDGWVFFTADRGGRQNVWSVVAHPTSIGPAGDPDARTASSVHGTHVAPASTTRTGS